MIVECPGCKSRYDVTGRPAGTQARCRCGTEFALPAPTGQAGELACPHCGGSVPPTNHACAYCGSHLLVKACPRCFARVFHGAKHCTQCGAETTSPAAANPDGSAAARRCPCCARQLLGRLVDDVLFDECEPCGGVFVDTTAIDRILTERRQARAESVLGALPAVDARPPDPARALYLKCPDCASIMNRRQFARGAKVVVDVCKPHGTWFDAGELSRVVEFAMKGGLERAAIADAEERHEQARRVEVQRRSAEITIHSTDPDWARGAKLSKLLAALADLFR